MDGRVEKSINFGGELDANVESSLRATSNHTMPSTRLLSRTASRDLFKPPPKPRNRVTSFRNEPTYPVNRHNPQHKYRHPQPSSQQHYIQDVLCAESSKCITHAPTKKTPTLRARQHVEIQNTVCAEERTCCSPILPTAASPVHGANRKQRNR